MITVEEQLRSILVDLITEDIAIFEAYNVYLDFIENEVSFDEDIADKHLFQYVELSKARDRHNTFLISLRNSLAERAERYND